MGNVVVLGTEEGDCNDIADFLLVHYHLRVQGKYTLVSEFMMREEEVQIDIILISFELLYHMDYDIITFIESVSKHSKVVMVLKEEKQYKFIEFKEFTGVSLGNSWDEKLISNDAIRNKNQKRVQCFGNFIIMSKGKELHAKWRTKKVKELFAYLIAHYDRVVSKDEILRLFYPREDKTKSLNKLYVTMSYLKKQLQELNIQMDEMTIYGDYSIYIAPEVCDYVDFDRFISKYSSIDKKNIMLAEEIIVLYQNMFLEEEDYLWAYDLREHLDKRYEEILIKMARYYDLNGNYLECERILVRLIEHNPFSVFAYNKLLNLYILTKRDEYYKKVFLQYKTMLKLEFSDTAEMEY